MEVNDRAVITRRRLIRHGLQGSALFALTPVIAACGGSSGSSTTATTAGTGTGAAAGTPRRGGTLTFARSVAPTQLDPANSIIAGDVYTLDKIFEPLFITSADGKLTPWLATRYETSADHLTWTFHLRPGVRFSDGTALTADDVVFSIRRAAGNARGPLSFLDSAIRTITAQGTDTVVIKLRQPWAPFLSDISVFANAILPRDFGGRSEKAFFAAPVGTGPFTLTGFKPDSNLTLTANPHYWQAGRPYLDSVQLNYVTDDNQRLLQLKGGQAQVIDSVPPANVASLRSTANVEVGVYPAWEVDLLVFNERVPQFADRHVRRAIAHAINTATLVQATSFGTARAGGSFFPPSLQYYAAATPVLTYSASAAAAEMAQSRYPNGFTTRLLISGGVQKWSEFGQIIQQALAPLKIDVRIQSLDHAAYETTFQRLDYEMFIDYAINDISDADEMASFEVDFRAGGSGSYWSSYDNPQAITLVHQAQSEFDPVRRAALYARLQALVAQDAPFVPLDYPPYLYANSSKVRGFAVNPGGAYRLEDVWLG